MKQSLISTLIGLVLGSQALGSNTGEFASYTCRVGYMKSLKELDPMNQVAFQVPVLQGFPKPVKLVSNFSVFCQKFRERGETLNCLFQRGNVGGPNFAVVAEGMTTWGAPKLVMRNVMLQGISYGVFCELRD